MTKKTKEKSRPFSLRLTFDERAQLERDAGSIAIGSYIRHQLFQEATVPKRRAPRKKPERDEAALAQVLAQLGASRLSSNLNQLAKAVNTGSLPVTPETEKDLREACEVVAEMRGALMQALGVGPGGAL